MFRDFNFSLYPMSMFRDFNFSLYEFESSGTGNYNEDLLFKTLLFCINTEDEAANHLQNIQKWLQDHQSQLIATYRKSDDLLSMGFDYTLYMVATFPDKDTAALFRLTFGYFKDYIPKDIDKPIDITTKDLD